ncbi:E2 protein [Tursiops truncatus papillomavirus 8]|nr:E2 protein [Tursiops truncatus papillomavirus 8]
MNMEKVSSLLNALQEQQMELCEKDSNNLKDHIVYWNLLRRESTLLCAARKKGITKIGIQAVPPSSVCEQLAREAIGMEIMLKSLETSEFGSESWSLTETSREMYNSEPVETLKKEGVTIRVIFDKKTENAMLYTLWKSVYKYVDGTWGKYKGGVDCSGIYIEEEEKVYYVNFKDEAKKYSELGVWAVMVQGKLLTDFELVTSSTDTTSCVSTSESLLETVGVYKENTSRTSSTSTVSTVAQTTLYQESGQKCKRSYKEDFVETRGGRRKRKHTTTNSIVTTSGAYSGGTTNYRPSGDTNNSHLLSNTPVVILSGTANQLKCLRFRLRKFPGLYARCSTTWQWLDRDGVSRTDSHRLSVSFDSTSQRENFIQTAALPDGVTYTTAYMPC